jgi:hypothetical protein
MLGIILARIKSVECDGLICHDAGRFVDWMRIDAMVLHIALGACHEKSMGNMKHMQPSEIDVPTINDIDGSSLWCNQIQRQRITHFTVGNMDKTGDRTTQVEQRVHFDGRFRASEIGPRKQRKTQIDCGAVESIDRIIKIEPDVIGGIELARVGDQNGGEIMPHAPVAQLIRISQRRLRNGATKSHAIQL